MVDKQKTGINFFFFFHSILLFNTELTDISSIHKNNDFQGH